MRIKIQRFGYGTALAIAVGVFALEMTASYQTNSQALYADAWHVFGDTIPLMLGWYALRARARGENTDQVEEWVSLTNILFLLLVGIVVGVGGLFRLWWPEPVYSGTVVVVAIIGAVGNLCQIFIAKGLSGAHAHSHTAQGQVAHFFSDFLSSIAVITGAVFVWFGLVQGDAVAAIIVAGLILLLAHKLYEDLDHEAHPH